MLPWVPEVFSHLRLDALVSAAKVWENVHRRYTGINNLIFAKQEITDLFLSYTTHTGVHMLFASWAIHMVKKLWLRSWNCYPRPHDGTVMNSEIWLALYAVRVSLSLLAGMVKLKLVICPFVYKVLKKVFKSFLFLFSNNNNNHIKGLLMTFLLSSSSLIKTT